MIKDEQGREWLLQKFYDEGWRYVVMDNYSNVYLTNEKPAMYDDGDEIRISSCGKYMGVTAISKFFYKLKNNEYIDIAKELGIVDWSKVAVDTPILVKANCLSSWARRYFAYFKDGVVFAWTGGATSWSCDNTNDVSSWDYVELAKEHDGYVIRK